MLEIAAFAAAQLLDHKVTEMHVDFVLTAFGPIVQITKGNKVFISDKLRWVQLETLDRDFGSQEPDI